MTRGALVVAASISLLAACIVSFDEFDTTFDFAPFPDSGVADAPAPIDAGDSGTSSDGDAGAPPSCAASSSATLDDAGCLFSDIPESQCVQCEGANDAGGCATPGRICCAQFKDAGACLPASDCLPAGSGIPFECDGPEDCSDGGVCCSEIVSVYPDASSCPWYDDSIPVARCKPSCTPSQTPLCHGASDCDAGIPCVAVELIAFPKIVGACILR